MFQSKEERLSALTKLIEKFSQNEEEYKKSDYKEAKLRTDFLNPFFKILDWDIENAEGKSEKYRDVIIEDRIEISGSRRAPDFCFRIGGQPKFYVEAKKPFVNIESEIAPSLQLRRYGHSAILPLSILTDFEEFAVYDTSIKPRKNDKASAARIMLIKYKDYVKEFDFLYGTFSRGAIEGGSFDKYAEGSKNKRGTDSIDRGLLELVENARLLLAKSISKLNEIGADYLNEAVIKIIDMTIFLKLAEDKGVENYEALLKAAQSDNLCAEVNKLFEAADERYNSGLFGEKLILKDINRSTTAAQNIASSQVKSLFIEPKILKEIIESFYFPECPYEFSVLPVSILGNIYEQFLGQTIRQTASGIIKIEEKPEVRKAGGVYYTPEYIVDYIIKNTVGEKIGGKTPKEIEAVKILDPACGSGSFLIRAYQFLLDYHLDYYQQPSRQAASLKQGLIKRFGVDSFRLSIPEKQRILTNNIFGVDIDAQAAETAKFSLLIKLMETETRESIDELFNPASIESKKGMKVLPDLDGNIKCGNSLIDKDFYFFEGIWELKVKSEELRVKEKSNIETAKAAIPVYSNKPFAFADNETIKKVNPFSWEETFPDIMKSGGFDCIVGNPPYVKYENLNSAFLEYAKRSFLSAASFFDIFQIFIEKGISLLKKQGVCGFIFPSLFLKGINYQTTRKILIENASIKLIKELGDGVFEKVKMPTCIMVFERGKTENNTLFFTDSGNKTLKIKQSDFINDNFLFIKKTFIDKLSNRCISLKDIAEVKRGLEIGKDKIINKRANAVKIIFGQDISRYAIKNLSYVDANISKKFKKSGEVFEGQKLVIRETGDRITAAFDDKSLLTNRSLYCIKTVDFDIKVLLALLNSKLFQYIYEQKFRADTGIFPKIRIGQALSLPIVKEIDKENSEKLKKLVNLMIEIQTKLQLEQNPKDKEIYQNKADILDKKIDAIVYDLYGLTEKEIAVIEKD